MGKMKANRKFKQADERAVSAVIGVILMVAITVAIAATVYVYVSGMVSSPGTQAPNVTFSKEETSDRLIVVSADSTANWARLGLKSDVGVLATGAPVFAMNAEVVAYTAANALVAGAAATRITTTSTVIAAGDFIDIESWDSTPSPGNALPSTKITVIDMDANKVLAEFTFSEIHIGEV
jgi:flagellin-like protein